MSIQVLPPEAWAEFRGQPGTIGINEGLHLAKINDPDTTKKPHNCFVKPLPEPPSLICEALGWLLAREAGVQCTPWANILMLDVQALGKCMPLPGKLQGLAMCPAWCSEVVPGSTVRQVNQWETVIKGKACLRSKDARKIASFDEWADLQDRNFGNVILGPKGYVSIDHETLLHSVLWAGASRQFHRRSLLDEALNRMDAKDFLRFKVDMKDAAAGHAQALQAAKADMDAIINILYPAHAQQLSQAVHQTLDQRSQQGWMAQRLGVVA